MSDDDGNDDWLEGAELDVSVGDLTFFEGQCIQLDPSRLPDPPGVA